MRRLFPLAVVCVVLVLWFVLVSGQPLPSAAQVSQEAGAAGTGPGLDYAPDRLLVKLRVSIQPELQADGAWRTGEPALDRLLAGQHVLATEQLFLAQQSEGGSDPLVLTASISSGSSRIIIPSRPSRLFPPTPTSSGPSRLPGLSGRYHPRRPAFRRAVGLVQIEAPAAWDVVTGSQAVAIAVVDSGLDFTHPDLSGKLWVNPGEIAGNGLDDDNNGYIDDVSGWDFVNDDSDPGDDHGHGTQVAGLPPHRRTTAPALRVCVGAAG